MSNRVYFPEPGSSAALAAAELRQLNPEAYFEGMETALREPDKIGEHRLFNDPSFAAGAFHAHSYRAEQEATTEHTSISIGNVSLSGGLLGVAVRLVKSWRDV